MNIDIRNKELLLEHFDENCSVVLLAGLVGDPISKKYPLENNDINLNGILNIVNICKQKIEKLIFISTCSNYGITDNDIKAKESHELNPLSLYATAKVSIEKYLMSLEKKSTFETNNT